MPTHTDNRHYGNFITGDVNVQGDINNVDGVSQEALLAFIPVSHDVSDQADGSEKEFNLNPPIKAATQNWVDVRVDGLSLTREADYYISPARSSIILTDDYGPAPVQGSSIVVVYVEDTPI